MKILNPSEVEVEFIPKVLLYGQSGAGKTTMACTFPDTLLVDLERGLGKNKPKSVAQLENFQELAKLVDMLAADDTQKYRTLVIDSLNELVEWVIRDVVLGFDAKRPYGDQLTMSDYGKIAREVNSIVREMIIKLNSRYAIVFTCAEKPVEHEEQKTISLVGKVLIETLPRLMDIVGCVFTAKDSHYCTIGNSSFAFAKNRYLVDNKPFQPTYQELLKKVTE